MKLQMRGWQIPKYTVKKFYKNSNVYCLIIPVLNEGERIKKQLQQIKKYSRFIDVVIVDGGSTDESTNEKFLKKVGVKVLIITPKGQSTQMRAGLSWAMRKGYKGVVTIDGNNKDDVSAITKFIKALDEGYDYVQASRFIKGGRHKNTPIDRVFFNRFVISPILSLAAGYWYTDAPLAFRGYSRKYIIHPEVKPFRKIFQRYELLFYMVIRASRLGLKTKEIATTRNYPKGEVPTKIVGWRKIQDLLNIFKIALGLYNPK